MDRRIHFGVVESRADPLMLGRCRVRIIGLHTDSLAELPTEDLPWAMPLQPITSAGMSGIGHAPVGPIEGTVVALQFLDDEQQMPLMIGTIAGIPGKSFDTNAVEIFTPLVPFPPEDDTTVPPPQSYVGTGSGGIATAGDGTPITTGTTNTGAKYLGNMTLSQYNAWKLAVAKSESGNNYSKVNTLGYSGKYQFGVAALEDLGYIVKGTWAKYKKNSILSDPTVWTGKNGLTSQSAYLSNGAIQEQVMDLNTNRNYKIIVGNGSVTADTPAEKLGGLLAVAHNQGAGSVKKFLAGNVTSDAYGTSTTKEYNMGYAAIAGAPTNEIPTDKNVNAPAADKGAPTIPSNAKYDPVNAPPKPVDVASKQGYADPNGVYPLKEFIDEADTPRLLRNQRINRTIVGEKENELITAIPVANTSTLWKQPPVPYNAKYPYNHVFVSEAGHVMEFDDTPDFERINIHHAAGTFTEIDPDGNQTTRIKGTKVLIVEDDELVLIQGSGHIQVDGDISIRVANTAQIQVLGDAQIHVGGNIKTTVDGTYDLIVKGDMRTHVLGSSSLVVDKDMKTLVKGSIRTQTAGNSDFLIGGSSRFQTGGTSDLKIGGAFSLLGSVVNIQGKKVNLNCNTSASGAVESGAAVAFDLLAFNPSIKQPIPITRDEVSMQALENSPEAQAKDDEVNDSAPTATVAQDTTPPPVVPSNPAVPGVCNFILPITANTQLTTNFTLSKLCRDGDFPYSTGQHNLKPEEIACNMKQLSMNVIEPLFAKYSSKGIKINSCFRPAGSKISTSVTVSQHELGCAVDLGFNSIRGDKTAFYNLAKEIIQVVSFDQFLLEQRGASVWIHISYVTNGNRKQVMTFVNDRRKADGLALIL